MKMTIRILMLVLLHCGIAVSSQAQQALVSGSDTLAYWQNDTLSGYHGGVLLTLQGGTTVLDANGSTLYTMSSAGDISDLNGDLIGNISSSGTVHDANGDLMGTLSNGEARDLNNDLLGSYGSTPLKIAGLYFLFHGMADDI